MIGNLSGREGFVWDTAMDHTDIITVLHAQHLVMAEVDSVLESPWSSSSSSYCCYSDSGSFLVDSDSGAAEDRGHAVKIEKTRPSAEFFLFYIVHDAVQRFIGIDRNIYSDYCSNDSRNNQYHYDWEHSESLLIIEPIFNLPRLGDYRPLLFWTLFIQSMAILWRLPYLR